MDQQRSMQFMQIAFQYLPEAKALLEKSGVELDMSMAQPVMDLLIKVMNEAYELGKQDAQN
ncbi:ComZ family protein [Ectobacillus antri]|jgi:competence protein ComZ|uniref:ComZ family protein n=1 Tax=Ectobacillus antri TaxID=2486280 RepID=A0ABT6H3L2_9BACI|nr:ComZ family protein [Ectobacillus antri]MDG4656663.1 ComZ family protein [Ectobacillus antri]MDG5753974.1 ComZ family protein [Ectobacillus antri]